MTERRRKKTKLFTNDIRSLLFAFGDVQDPLNDTVDAMEDILLTFLVNTCHDAANFAKVTRRQKIKVDDFAFCWRRDPMKFGRVFELLRLQDDIKEARKQFDNSEGKSLKSLNNVDDDDDGRDDDDVGEGEIGGSEANGDGKTASVKATKKEKKQQNAEPERKKRKYTKSGKERKPYKKRAKKVDASATS